MIIKFAKKFEKQLKRAPGKIKKDFDKKFTILLGDAYSPILRNHTLVGKYIGYRSINVSGDWRAVYREYRKENPIVFVALGTHSQLYK